MPKKMLINASHPEECRVAVVSDGKLEELDIQINTRESTLGNIYKATVSRTAPSLQAVFVDYSSARNGFLPINDVHPSYFPESFQEGRKRPRIQDLFATGDDVLVQVNKEERDNKGASLTTNLSLAGRYLVLMPGTELKAVSRKIEDEKERKKLKEILRQFSLPENMGLIVRTAGLGRTKTELNRDLNYLLKLWKAIEKNMAEVPSPALLYKEQDVVIRSIREYFSSDISEILVDEKEVYKKARDFFEQVMPRYKKLVKLHQEKRPLFNKYQLEEQVSDVYKRRINLKSGGYIVIEATEALVTVDVNSGSATKEKDIEETAFRVNMEAAEEVGRQLRLRDLGGIICVDFIDMFQKKHNQEVERVLKFVLKKDRAKSKLLKISPLGVLELSRQRLKSSLGTGEYHECPFCRGQGKIRSPEMLALSVFRKVKSLVIKTDVSEVKATVPAPVAQYLLNEMRSLIVEIENQYCARVFVEAKENLPESGICVEPVKEVTPPSRTDGPAVEPLCPPLEPVSEEVSKPEPEKKRTKKPSRRRRRGPKKKPSPGVEDAAMEAETGVPADQEGDSEADWSAWDEEKDLHFAAGDSEQEPDEARTDTQMLADEHGPDESTAVESLDSYEKAVDEEPQDETEPRSRSLRDFLPFS